MNYKDILKIIDHTLLKAESSHDDIVRLCDEAKKYGVATVFTHGYWTPVVSEELKGSSVRVGATAGFPFGAQSTFIKATEASSSIKDGADEIDIVLNVGALKSKDYGAVLNDVSEVRKACSGGVLLKVILENCLLTDQEKIDACRICVDAGADFVKTSTGLSTGGATLHDVELMKKTVDGKAKVKAAGGIRTLKDCIDMINAGADRIGTSAMLRIAKEIEEWS